MTNDMNRDPFEVEVREAFRRKLDTLDSLVPNQLARAQATGRAANGLMSAPRVRSGLSLGSGAVRFAAVVAVLVLVAAIAGPTLLLRGNAAATGSSAASQAPTLSPLASTSAAPNAQATTLTPRIVASFGTDELTAAVLGPDGAAYVIDAGNDTVYRVDLDTGDRIKVVESGLRYSGGNWIFGKPVRLAVGGPDVVILDSLNSILTWQAAQGDKTGRGVLKKASIPDNVTWGLGVRAVGTFVVNAELGLYNLYVVVPTAQQILKYQPAPDGSGYPKGSKSKYLAVDQDVSNVDDMYVDGMIFLIDHGRLVRYDRGQVSSSWTAASGYAPAVAPYFTHVTADDPNQDKGNFYVYDRTNGQVVAMRKLDGAYVAAYRATAGLDDVRSLFVAKAATGSETLYWTSGGKLWSAPLSAGSAAVP